MEVRRELTVQLASVVKSALRSADSDSGRDQLPVEIVHNVCCVLEATFMHGLKDAYVARRLSKYPEPNFWPFVEKFAHRSVTQQIKKLNLIKTDIGRSRVWIRIALNEAVLEHYVRAFLRDRNTVRAYYFRHAFLRDSEQVEILCNYLKGLCRVNVNAPLNSSMLNDWTPTPLQLAGYVTGNGDATGASRQRLVSVAQMEDIPEIEGDEDLGTDVAVSALEFDGLERRPSEPAADSQHGVALLSSPAASSQRLRVDSSAATSSPLARPNSRSVAAATSDDDNGSTVSHMSLLDHRYNQLVRTLADDVNSEHTSTPSDTSDDLLNAPVDQVLVKRNRRGSHRRGRRARTDLTTSISRVHQQHVANGSAKCRANDNEPSEEDNEQLSRSLADELAEATMLEAIGRAENVQSDARAEVSTDSGTVVDQLESSITVENDSTVPSDPVQPDGSGDVQRSSAERDSAPTTKSTTSTTSSFERNETVAALTDRLVDETHNAVEAMRETNVSASDASALAETDATETDMCDQPARDSSPLPDRCFSPAGNSLQGRTWSESEQVDTRVGSPSTAAGPCGLGETHVDFGTALRNALQDRDDSDARWRAAAVADGYSSTLGGDGAAWADALNQTTEIATAASTADHTADFRRPTDGVDAGTSAVDRRGSDDGGPAAGDFDIVHHAEADRAASEWHAANEWRLKLLSELPDERGLYAQNFKCPTCNRNIGAGVFAAYRKCCMDGQYYCDECHRDDTSVLPALLVHNWDGRPAAVCRASRAFLEHVADRPLIRIDAANPALYEHSKPMFETKMLRERLSLTAMYLLTCKETVADDLRKRLWPKEYLFEDIHLYSLNDLAGVATGALQRHVQAVLSFATAHVSGCRLCAQKGFICEICNHPQIIYPFQTDTTHRCGKCFSVYHSACMRDRVCPKCERRDTYLRQKAASTASVLTDDPLGFDDQ